jgi:hypothetical protein
MKPIHHYLNSNTKTMHVSLPMPALLWTFNRK